MFDFDELIAYEEGELDDERMLALFGELIRGGQAWTLQGHYGRQAAHLIEMGYLMPGSGEITDLARRRLEQK